MIHSRLLGLIVLIGWSRETSVEVLAKYSVGHMAESGPGWVANHGALKDCDQTTKGFGHST